MKITGHLKLSIFEFENINEKIEILHKIKISSNFKNQVEKVYP